MTQAPVLDEAGACVVPAPDDTPQRRRGDRFLRAAIGWGLVLVAVILLWPAQWGGLSGITVVSGHSMEPTYRTGDLVVTWRSPAYEIGDIVSYTVPADQPGAGGHVIHRISAIADAGGSPVYTTTGDNNPAADQWALSSSDITGAAVLHVPGLGRLLRPALLPYVAAALIGAIVTVLLWRSQDDGEAESADEADPTTAPTDGSRA